MMTRIVNTTRRFGYLPCYRQYAANEGAVGLYADLTECEFLADGRALLQATLSGRFRIKSSWVEDGTQNLWYATTEAFDDDALASEEEKEAVDSLVANALEKVDQVDGRVRARIEEAVGVCPRNSPENLSFWLVAVSGFPESEKQALLESTDTKARLEAAMERLGDVIDDAQASCAVQ